MMLRGVPPNKRLERPAIKRGPLSRKPLGAGDSDKSRTTGGFYEPTLNGNSQAKDRRFVHYGILSPKFSFIGQNNCSV